MPITADQIVSAIKEHKLIPLYNGTDFTWSIKRLHNGRISGGRDKYATLEIAFEAAIAALSTVTQSMEFEQSRLLQILSTGRIRQRSRDVQVTIDGLPVTVKVWDILRASDNAAIVTGSQTLISAIRKAEEIGGW